MSGVNVKSEIKPLKKVLLHRPGKELLNLTPNTLEELLFDDIPFLKVAQEEHDAFAQALRDNGVEVFYLEDLMAEVLEANPELREQFLKQWIEEAGIRTDRYQKIIFDYMQENYLQLFGVVGAKAQDAQICAGGGVGKVLHGIVGLNAGVALIFDGCVHALGPEHGLQLGGPGLLQRTRRTGVPQIISGVGVSKGHDLITHVPSSSASQSFCPVVSALYHRERT